MNRIKKLILALAVVPLSGIAVAVIYAGGDATPRQETRAVEGITCAHANGAAGTYCPRQTFTAVPMIKDKSGKLIPKPADPFPTVEGFPSAPYQPNVIVIGGDDIEGIPACDAAIRFLGNNKYGTRVGSMYRMCNRRYGSPPTEPSTGESNGTPSSANTDCTGATPIYVCYLTFGTKLVDGKLVNTIGGSWCEASPELIAASYPDLRILKCGCQPKNTSKHGGESKK